MSRVYNFSAGPAILPVAVLEKAQNELTDYHGTGMSVMEMSHRSSSFNDIIESAENDLRSLMRIPDHYKVLFLQGGASTQFAMVPLNLMSKHKKADYINTGSWSQKAIEEAQQYGTVNVLASSEDKNFSYIPSLKTLEFTPDSDYIHITTNNTIYGTLFPELPEAGNIPLIADMSSNILSQEYDITKFGLIYAGAQKNIGPAGVTIVIIREDLIGHATDFTPRMLNYQTHSESNSMYNTPPCYPIYMAGLVFKWLLENGGIIAMEKKNREKASLLYDFLDRSSMFKGTVEKDSRSLMNIPFVTGNDALDSLFIKEAEANNLKTLKGHRTVGGMRASIYNAMPIEGVEALITFMKHFEEINS